MRESQHKPAIEIGEAQEASKFNECGWGWSVMQEHLSKPAMRQPDSQLSARIQ
jgi:hypothetical protein